jgi:hypothetical protein
MGHEDGDTSAAAKGWMEMDSKCVTSGSVGLAAGDNSISQGNLGQVEQVIFVAPDAWDGPEPAIPCSLHGPAREALDPCTLEAYPFSNSPG